MIHLLHRANGQLIPLEQFNYVFNANSQPTALLGHGKPLHDLIPEHFSEGDELLITGSLKDIDQVILIDFEEFSGC